MGASLMNSKASRWSTTAPKKHSSFSLTDDDTQEEGNGIVTSFPPPRSESTAVYKLLANALELSAPATDAVVKKHNSSWIQLAGHPGNFAPAGPRTIWKKQPKGDQNEVQCLRELMNDSVKDAVPRFYREVDYLGTVYLEMEDLLKHFKDPNVMDVKIGTRTFLESEVKNPELRHDLYDKMIQIDPKEPTEEERKQAAITKLRYMQFREGGSSSALLGFRIEAVRHSGEPPSTDFKKVRTKDKVTDTIVEFVSSHRSVCKQFHRRLLKIRRLFESSEYFRYHEIIGSSLLFAYDSKKHANVWMIDFAKTIHVPESRLTHRAQWSPGNHEDGYLTGLDNLIQIFKELSTKLKPSANGKAFRPSTAVTIQ